MVEGGVGLVNLVMESKVKDSAIGGELVKLEERGRRSKRVWWWCWEVEFGGCGGESGDGDGGYEEEEDGDGGVVGVGRGGELGKLWLEVGCRGELVGAGEVLVEPPTSLGGGGGWLSR